MNSLFAFQINLNKRNCIIHEIDFFLYIKFYKIEQIKTINNLNNYKFEIQCSNILHVSTQKY